MSQAPQNAATAEARLSQASDRALESLSELSHAALAAKDAALGGLTTDLYLAANRAWHELDAIRRLHGRKP